MREKLEMKKRKKQKGRKMPKKSITKTRKPPKIAKVKALKATATTPVGGLIVSVFDITGKRVGTLNLPKEKFGLVPKESTIAQALRVYRVNHHTHTASTKTRGEVRGGGAKPWRQKGTGRARAGSSRSPLWVGGGIVFGPRSRKVILDLPKKMKKKATLYALAKHVKQGKIAVISNLDKLSPKTKEVNILIENLKLSKPVIFVISNENRNLRLATNNIQKVSFERVEDLNALTITNAKNLLFDASAIEKI